MKVASGCSDTQHLVTPSTTGVQVRRVGNAAAVLRAINSKLETATTGKADAGTALSSAEADKAAADAAKPPPAAEQAAEGDEAAAAEGEEEETEE